MTRPIAPRVLLAAVLVTFGGCHHAQAACRQPPVETAVALIELFATDRLTLDAAASLLGADHTALRSGRYWQVRSATCSLEIVLPDRDPDAPLREAELRLPLNAGLRLRDLQERYGHGERVFSSKTSSTRFLVPAPSGSPIFVFARLFSPDIEPDAAVLALVVRRSDQP